MKTDLEHGFDDLLGDGDRHRRGYQFQKWLRDVLLLAGFEVHTNPRTAIPRQTDIYARHAGHDYVIEAKWRKAAIDVSDIDALRNRLARTASDIVGCFFSLSDYAKTAIAAVEERRTREILLFNAAEIQDLARNPAALPGLIENKRKSLRVHARVHFANAKADEALPSEIRLPSSELRLWSGGSVTDYVASDTDNIDVVFSQQHLDPIGNSDDAEFRLRLDLDVRHLPDLRQVLGTLHNHLDLSGTGTFAIHQTKVSWHGAGAEDFLTSAAAWRSRYRATALESFHHSEELHYFDEFNYGRLILTARQRVGESVFLHSAEGELRVAGIPLDREPLLELCRKTGNREAVLTFCPEKYLDQLRFRSDRVSLDPVGLILSTRFSDDTAVSGIIARNPFFRNVSTLTMAGLKDGSQIEYLSNVEILCCSLMDWHDVGDVADEYYLTGIESKWIGQALVVRPICTWKHIINRPRSQLAGVPVASRRRRRSDAK